MKMAGVDRVDHRTFRSNFTADGVARLRERVNEKLKELMGDYTDDTLVVWVLGFSRLCIWLKVGEFVIYFPRRCIIAWIIKFSGFVYCLFITEVCR